MYNEIKYVEFTDKDKIKFFNEIAEKFYYANFGQASKSEIELMMFNFYLKKMIEKNRRPDETIDYNNCSDYHISKELGITQQRVRNLKIKKQLVYPEKFKWEVSLAGLMDHARLENSKVIINIPDPNLFIDIQNFIEENGGYIETQLNSKILQIRQEYFLMLAFELESEKSKKEIIKELKKKLNSHNADNTKLDKKQLVKLLSHADSFISVVTGIVSLFDIGKPLIEGLIQLFN